MKERSIVSVLRHPQTWLLGTVMLFCLLAVSGCGSTGNAPRSETAHVYDSAHVLNAAEVQKAASNVPANVDVYTMNGFSGTQADFQRAMADKVGNDPGRIVVGIDPQHNYQYIARGSDVPLSTSNIVQASTAFATNYGDSNYTRATIAQLHSLGDSIRANGAVSANRPGNSPLPWLIPLLILGAILFALAQTRRPQGRTQTPHGPIYRPRQPERRLRDTEHEQNPPPFPTIDQSTYQRERGAGAPGTAQPPTTDKERKGPNAGGPDGTTSSPFGYELEKRPGETKPPTPPGPSRPKGPESPEQGDKGPSSKKKPDADTGGTPKPIDTDTGRHFGQAPKLPDTSPGKPDTGPRRPPSSSSPEQSNKESNGKKKPDTGISAEKRAGQAGTPSKPPDATAEKRAGQAGTPPKPPDTTAEKRAGQAGTPPKPPDT
ncbi:MAG: hypothetical protein ACRDHZ_17140, partial [Ktedonobacteraceae bacterium]